MKTLLTSLLSLTLFLTGLQVVQAEARRDGNAADPLRRAQYMIRQLSQEKSKLEAETARLNAEVQSLNSQIETLQGQLDKTQGKLGQSRERNDQLVTRVKSDVEKYRQLADKYRQTVVTLKAAIADNQHLVQAVNERDDWIGQCQQKNESMYQANVELLDRYQHKTAWDALKQDDPVTGIASVELENQVQDFQFKLEDLQVTPYKPSLDHQAYALPQASGNPASITP